jgi:hypothetical protein
MARSKAITVCLVFIGLLCANIFLQQRVANAQSKWGTCALDGSGYGGIYDGPWETSVPCSGTGGGYCWEASCNCGSGEDDFYDAHCLLEHVCAGQCAGR